MTLYHPADPHQGGSPALTRQGPRAWSYRALHQAMGWTDQDAARRLGCAMRTIERWKREGISDTLADAIAVHLNTHPVLVWPAWFEKAAA